MGIKTQATPEKALEAIAKLLDMKAECRGKVKKKLWFPSTIGSVLF